MGVSVPRPVRASLERRDLAQQNISSGLPHCSWLAVTVTEWRGLYMGWWLQLMAENPKLHWWTKMDVRSHAAQRLAGAGL